MLKFLLPFLFIGFTACETFELQDYPLRYEYHKKLGGGGVEFGVMSHNFVEISKEKFDSEKHLMILLSPKAWEMISSDLLIACNMLKKKCKQQISFMNSVFYKLEETNKELEKK